MLDGINNLTNEIKPNSIVKGSLFPERIQLISLTPFGASFKLIGKGLTTGQFYDPILTAEQLAALESILSILPFILEWRNSSTKMEELLYKGIVKICYGQRNNSHSLSKHFTKQRFNKENILGKLIF